MDKELYEAELQIMDYFLQSQEIKRKIIECGNIEEARKTGERYQQITEEDAETIIKSLDKLFDLFGKISSNALLIQAKTVEVRQNFINSLKEVDDV